MLVYGVRKPFFLYLTLRLSCNVLPRFLPLLYLFDVSLSPISLIGDFKLPLNFIIKPHSARTALAYNQNTHTHTHYTQADANMPSEALIIQGNRRQIHVFKKKGNNRKENWKSHFCREVFIEASVVHKSTKAHRAEEEIRMTGT